jgi:hypothetical protein
MEYKLKSRDGNSEILLKYTEKQAAEGQQTSYSFSCSLKNNTFSSKLENIWFDEGDIEEICDGICNYVNDPSNGFNSFPSYSDLIIRIEKSDSQGHHSVKCILEDKSRSIKQEGHFEVDLIDLEKLESYFRSFLL